MKKVHFLGIGGSGGSAIAAIAQAQGFTISGCDKKPFNEFTRIFDQSCLFEGHSPEHLTDVQILAVTPAVYALDAQNPELLAAKEKGIRIMTWQEFMGEFLEKDKFVIAVCGTHGKSTTTAMIGLLLEEAGLDPTVELGAVIPEWSSNFRIGKSRYFVSEADEFNDNFLVTHPNIAICTTIEMDHPEYYKDFDAYKNSFKKFFNQTKEKIIANLSDKGVNDVLASQGQALEPQIIDYSNKLIDFPLQVPGKHNILNASAAYQVGIALGIDPEIIKKSLSKFSGIGRRFEFLGKYNEAEIYSDFAHHPTEIRVTLEAAKEKFPDKKIIVAFQPHMFSRTKALFGDFVKVFQQIPATKTYIMDIFPSREVDTGLVNSQQLVEAIGKDNVSYIESNQVLEKIKNEAQKDVVVFFIGAGANHQLAEELVKENNHG